MSVGTIFGGERMRRLTSAGYPGMKNPGQRRGAGAGTGSGKVSPAVPGED